eukprot:COSAG05_NODE_88_length_20344_cov_12.094690_2_plen_82_part_00
MSSTRLRDETAGIAPRACVQHGRGDLPQFSMANLVPPPLCTIQGPRAAVSRHSGLGERPGYEESFCAEAIEAILAVNGQET